MEKVYVDAVDRRNKRVYGCTVTCGGFTVSFIPWGKSIRKIAISSSGRDPYKSVPKDIWAVLTKRAGTIISERKKDENYKKAV